MRVNKEEHVLQMMTLNYNTMVQQKASVEYCDPDCDDSRLSAIVIAKCCSVCVLTAYCVLLLV